MSRGVRIVPDQHISECETTDWDAVVCPGGMPGAVNLHRSAHFIRILEGQASRKGLIAAICAAPAVVLAPLGLLRGRRATCYPSEAFQRENMQY